MTAAIMNFTTHIHMGDEIIVITHDELAKFAKVIRLDEVAANRYTWILVSNLYVYEKINGIDTRCIIDEIKALEDTGESHTKPATQFKNPPLYPLWHKHYFSAHFLARNIHAELKRGDKLGKIMDEVLDPNKSPVFTEERVWELSQRVAHEPFQERSEDARITGEWIVFSKHGGENIYLCMATHDSGDQVIYDTLALYCKHHFSTMEPFASASHVP